MALGSPGVEVTVIDESFYTPAAPGTVPLIFVATSQDKTNPSGSTAQGTTAANAGKVWIITSQRDLVDTFGTPVFPTDVGGNAIHGGELNEYGLQSAYSLLGVSSRAYVTRADVNLGQLAPSTGVPTGDPVAGTYWVDTDATLYGVYEWDASGKGSFVRKTPLIIDADNVATDANTSLVPKDSFGQQGNYAMVVTSDNANTLYYKTTATSNAWVAVEENFNGGKSLQISPHYTYPTWTTATVTGSVWVKTTTPGLGANWSVKYYNGGTKTWGTVSAPIYDSTRQALEKFDYAGGGKNIATGVLFVESNFNHLGATTATNELANFKIWRRNSTGATTVVSQPSTLSTSSNSVFYIRETLASSGTWGAVKTVTVTGSTTTSVAANIPAAVSAAGLTNVSATYDAATQKVTFQHALGGDFELKDSTGTPLAVIGLTAYNMTTKLGTVNLYTAPTGDYQTGTTSFDFIASNWKPLVYEAKKGAPFTTPANGRLWFDANLSDVDILEHDGTKWVGYLNAHPTCDPAGPIVSATQPTTQSDGSSLVDGDIWVSTADTERYGKDVYVYNGSTLKWDLQDVTDNNSPNGWVFANARWAASGQASKPATIKALLSSDYVDPDVPDPALYPKGIKLWNLRRSGYTVKKYVVGHIDITANNGLNTRFANDQMDAAGNEYFKDRWVCVSPNNADGSGTFGRKAQRAFVVSALKSAVDTNQTVRDTDTLNFNLLACPGYPELISNMVSLNTDRGQTAFVVGDTPFRLAPTANALTAWGNNTNGAVDNGETGLVTSDEYLGVFYPSGYSTDNTGKNIVVPSSHMMLRTIVNSDAKSYQWFAPAGTRRGAVDNATSVGYINSVGEFQTVSLYENLRTVLHDVAINPIATIPGAGLVNFGQKTRAKNASALDRINVARLVAYLRRQLTVLAKPFLFEPNDEQTRREIKSAAESLLIELVGQRALYDFIVVCDSSNNTPARIDKSELWMDIAIEPVKAVEFIYIPLRIKNTGEIGSGA